MVKSGRELNSYSWHHIGGEIKLSNISSDHIYDNVTAEESILLLFNRSPLPPASHLTGVPVTFSTGAPSLLLHSSQLLSHRARRASYLSNWTATC